MYLYHLRDPLSSAGFGHDGYVGVTDDPERRRYQHMHACATGTHPNPRVQAMYDSAPEGLAFFVIAEGDAADILCKERLLVPRARHHANLQKGGGPYRHLTEDEALARLLEREKERESRHRQGESQSTGGKSHSDSRKKREAHDDGGLSFGSLPPPVGGGSTAIRAAFSGFGATAAATGAGLLTVGLGTAYAMNRTVLCDDVRLTLSERQSRSAGRLASYTGGVVGSVGTLGLIGASGTVAGLSTAGVAAGVTAIGSAVGGSLIMGTVIVAALPAAAAAGLGYGTYRVWRYFR